MNNKTVWQICYFPTECKEKCKHPYCTFFHVELKV